MTTSDSYKMPTVMIGFVGSTNADDMNRAVENAKTFDDISRSLSDAVVFRGYDTVQEFSHEINIEGSGSIANVTLFDPRFDDILSKLILSKKSSQGLGAFGYLRTFFSYGWSTDGPGDESASPVYFGIVTSIETEVRQSGVVLNVSIVQDVTYSLSARKVGGASRRYFEEKTPAHLIVKDVLENAWKTDPVYPKCKVLTPVECEPLQNNGNYRLLTDMSPYHFAMDIVKQAVPTGRLKNERLALVSRGSDFVLTVPGVSTDSVTRLPVRSYAVPTGSDPRVISFRPSSSEEIANILGGDGVTIGIDSTERKASKQYAGKTEEKPSGTSAEVGVSSVIDARGRESVIKTLFSPRRLAKAAEDVFDQAVKAVDQFGKNFDEIKSFYYNRHDFSRTFETAAQRRRATYNRASLAGFLRAELEIIGDPTLRILDDPVEIITTQTWSPSLGIDNKSRIVRIFSGVFSIVGLTHNISGGNYTTTLHVIQSVSAQNKPDLSARKGTDSQPFEENFQKKYGFPTSSTDPLQQPHKKVIEKTPEEIRYDKADAVVVRRVGRNVY